MCCSWVICSLKRLTRINHERSVHTFTLLFIRPFIRLSPKGSREVTDNEGEQIDSFTVFPSTSKPFHKHLMVSTTRLKSFLNQHYVSLVNYGPVDFEMNDKVVFASILFIGSTHRHRQTAISLFFQEVRLGWSSEPNEVFTYQCLCFYRVKTRPRFSANSIYSKSCWAYRLPIFNTKSLTT